MNSVKISMSAEMEQKLKAKDEEMKLALKKQVIQNHTYPLKHLYIYIYIYRCIYAPTHTHTPTHICIYANKNVYLCYVILTHTRLSP